VPRGRTLLYTRGNNRNTEGKVLVFSIEVVVARVQEQVGGTEHCANHIVTVQAASLLVCAGPSSFGL
jgi:hypothetical protein